MALASPMPRTEPKGREHPRLAPPRPLKHRLDILTDEAACMGIVLIPSQLAVGRYLYAVSRDKTWLYQEIADIVARQNGKTELLKPHVCARLRMGRRIMHSAQNRELPREVFGHIAEHMVAKHSDELAKPPRFANGQEEIILLNGGRYRIVAPTRGGARGPSNDDLILDEVRELVTHEFPAAAGPTLSASPNPQTLYLSNMGDESSAVLNALKLRSVEDPALAYLEWSADPKRKADDLAGWLEANPSVGYLPGKLRNLEREYKSHRLGGTLPVWETEFLCRSVISMKSHLVDPAAWTLCEAPDVGQPRNAYMGIAMDPSGKRASAAVAWRLPDESIAMRLLFDVPGNPIDTDELGKDLRTAAGTNQVLNVAYDPLTDRELAKFFRKSEAVGGLAFANASSRFSLVIESARLRYTDADAVTDDLAWTTRKQHDESGRFEAVRASDERPITAALAAIRAVWLASGPTPTTPRIW